MASAGVAPFRTASVRAITRLVSAGSALADALEPVPLAPALAPAAEPLPAVLPANSLAEHPLAGRTA